MTETVFAIPGLGKYMVDSIKSRNYNVIQGTERNGRYSPIRETWRLLKKNGFAMLGLCVIAIMVFFALFPQLVAPYSYDDQNYNEAFQAPCPQHIMGTDNCGRDIFSRIVYGARISIQICFISISISVTIGGGLGVISAYYGDLTDNIIMRIIDIMLAIPSTLLAISIAAALEPGMFNVMIAVGIGGIPSYAHIARASVLTVKEQEYVEAARAIGGSDLRIVLKHMISNALSPIIVQATLGVAGTILNAAGLSFIGLGVQPPIPEWGAMLSLGRQYIMSHWYIVTFSGLVIMLVVFAVNLVGDGLRDALDPRLKR